MNAAPWERTRAVFLAACRADPAARADVLDRECGADAALRAEVESLLVHHDRQRAGHAAPMVATGAAGLRALTDDGEEPLPRAFGHFELLEILGRGGMGTVYRARQERPEREVAVKVIRSGMLSPSTLRRFRQEADLLARLQHPGIAAIFEAGTVRSGGEDRPYFAMELVSGRPIDLDATERELGLRDRLETFAQVCDAVQHAHERGVIHRDLKPGNVLVDSTGQPRVLDFGVARAIDVDVRTTTLRTGAGEFFGTLPYMSPEQVSPALDSGSAREVDARSDVFALGVLLFELLTGRLPHDLRGKSLADTVLTIRDAEPARLGAVSPHLRGDLETIVATALEKDPSRRYGSAAALAADLRRYLGHQPIEARPPSVAHQLRLFARRHRALVGGVVLAATALILATAISIGFAVRSQRAAIREGRQRLVAERTRDHLKSMLMLPDPHREGAELTVAEMLDLMVRRLDEGEELPEVEAEVRAAVGRTYLTLRRSEQAVEQLSRSAELWRAVDPVGSQLADVLVTLGNAHFQAEQEFTGIDRGRASAARMEAHASGQAGVQPAETPQWGDAGEAALREAIELLSDRGGAALEAARGSLLDGLIRRKKFDEAAPIAGALLEHARQAGQPLPVIAGLRRLAKVQTGLGDHANAWEHLEEARRLAERHLPEAHPINFGVLVDRSWARWHAGEIGEAAAASRAAHALATRVGRPGSHDWMICVNTHLAMLAPLDRREEMIAVLTSARSSLATALGAEHATVRQMELRLEALAE